MGTSSNLSGTELLAIQRAARIVNALLKTDQRGVPNPDKEEQPAVTSERRTSQSD